MLGGRPGRLQGTWNHDRAHYRCRFHEDRTALAQVRPRIPVGVMDVSEGDLRTDHTHSSCLTLREWLRVAGDLSVVGFDNLPEIRSSIPR